MKIRPYSPDKKEEVAKFFAEIFAEMGWDTAGVDKLSDPAGTFHLPEGIFLLAIEEDTVIGTGGN